MDASRVKKWIGRNIRRLRYLAGAYHWRIEYDIEPLQDCAAVCTPHLKYEIARIKVDSAQIYSFAELEKIMLHELYHLSHSSFHLLWEAVEPFLPDERTKDSILSVYNYAKELTVLSIERISECHLQHVLENHGETLGITDSKELLK